MSRKNRVEMAETRIFSKNLIAVDGITRAGKFWIASMLAHFERMEHVQHRAVMDLCVSMHLMGVISENAARSLLQNEANTHMYETSIGRNLNFRFADSSSVYKNPNLQAYLQRVAGPDALPHDVAREIGKSDRLFLFIAHNWLCNAPLCFRAFPDLKLIRMERNPIDLVYAWFAKGHGRPQAFAGRIAGEGGPQPWFASGWSAQYDGLKEMDRIIQSVVHLDGVAKKAFRALPDSLRRRILFTSYEALGSSPMIEAERIADFLGTRPGRTLGFFIAQDTLKKRDLRSLESARADKLSRIRRAATPRYMEMLVEMDRRYAAS